VKIGAENKKELIAMAVLLVIAVPLVIYRFAGSSGSGSAAASAPAAQTNARPQSRPGVALISQNSLDPTVHLEYFENSRKVKYEAGGRNIFTMEAEIPIVDKNPRQVETATPIPTPPTPTPLPPIPLKFFGLENKPNEPKRVFLSEGDAVTGTVFVAKQGDIVDRRYRVVQIATAYVVIEDVFTNNKQQIPLTAR
jgi:hypothetical protein